MRKPTARDIIDHDGDRWEVLALGTERDGKVYTHLASTTRCRKQRNGNNPIQVCDWIEVEKLLTVPKQAL